MRGVATLGIVAAVFWFVIFSPWTAGWMNFWAQMMLATGLLAGSAVYLNQEQYARLFRCRVMQAALGVLSAAVLYGIFYLGYWFGTAILDFASSQVANIYANKAQAPPALIATVLVVWIGPAEEIFWRGYIQKSFADRWGSYKGYILASLIYALVHIWAFNFMLVMAALVAGLFWGLLFVRTGSLWPGIISHALWDVAIFILWPIQ
ncbi:lysostaphin resistance A-like protein [Candidatus Neomarinimicrobiota bacterium]